MKRFLPLALALLAIFVAIFACKSNEISPNEQIPSITNTNPQDENSTNGSNGTNATSGNTQTSTNASTDKSQNANNSGGENNSPNPNSPGAKKEANNEQTTKQNIHNESIRIRERSDYRTYINGKYSGLTYRETETFLNKRPSGTNSIFSGKAFVVQDTRRNLVSQAKRLDEAIDIYYTKKKDGSEVFSKDKGFPLLRSFFDTLNLPYETLQKGAWWETEAEVSVLPLKEESPVILPVLVYYEYAGRTTYLNKPVYKVVGKYAIRYNGDERFTNMTGTRDMEIFIDCETNTTTFVREKVTEQFTYRDGRTVKNEGSLLHFYDYADYNTTLITSGSGIVGIEINPGGSGNGGAGSGNSGSGNSGNNGGNSNSGSSGSSNGSGSGSTIDLTDNTGDYTVEYTDLGLQLRLQNLRFVADQALLLPGEEQKLDKIANILTQFPNKTFFVEGHTASTGRPADEKLLSEQRAEHIVNELVKRGLKPERFIYTGSGATKPIADNTTESGKAKNRRVEITILD